MDKDIKIQNDNSEKKQEKKYNNMPQQMKSEYNNNLNIYNKDINNILNNNKFNNKIQNEVDNNNNISNDNKFSNKKQIEVDNAQNKNINKNQLLIDVENNIKNRYSENYYKKNKNKQKEKTSQYKLLEPAYVPLKDNNFKNSSENLINQNKYYKSNVDQNEMNINNPKNESIHKQYNDDINNISSQRNINEDNDTYIDNQINNNNFNNKYTKYLTNNNNYLINEKNMEKVDENKQYIDQAKIDKNRNNIKNKKPNNNIFLRLFKDAQYQRFFPKKPCHFRYKKLNKSKEIIEINKDEKKVKRTKKNDLKIGNKISSNYGEYLYERNKKYQEEKEKRMLLIKQKKYEEEKKNYPFKPNINTEYITNKNMIIDQRENSTNREMQNINNNLNRDIYSNINKYFKTEKPKLNSYNYNQKSHKNNSFFNKNQNQYNNKIIKDQLNLNKNRSQNYQIINSNYNISQNPNCSKIKLNNNKNITNAKLQHFYQAKQLLTSKSSNNCYFNNDVKENKNIFINLFNDLDIDEDNIIIGNNLNTSKVPKNILRIINPVIKEILKNKNKPIAKDEFIFYMNNLFNNMSSIDKRLLIYTYNNRHNKNKSFIIYNNNKNTATTMRPSTPNYSTRANHFKNEMNKRINYNYEYNYYNYDKMRQMNCLNDNIGIQNTKMQKDINQYLYGNNNNYYNGY